LIGSPTQRIQEARFILRHLDPSWRMGLRSGRSGFTRKATST
jgi:hypothetical protein